MGKVKELIEEIKEKEELTTPEVLTKYKELAKLLHEEEEQEKLHESTREQILLKG